MAMQESREWRTSRLARASTVALHRIRTIPCRRSAMDLATSQEA